MSTIIEQIVKEHERTERLNKMIKDIRDIFDFTGHELDIINHLKEWKKAQPITTMQVKNIIGEVRDLIDDARRQARDIINEVESARSSLDEAEYYSPNDCLHDAEQKLDDILSDIESTEEVKEA